MIVIIKVQLRSGKIHQWRIDRTIPPHRVRTIDYIWWKVQLWIGRIDWQILEYPEGKILNVQDHRHICDIYPQVNCYDVGGM